MIDTIKPFYSVLVSVRTPIEPCLNFKEREYFFYNYRGCHFRSDFSEIEEKWINDFLNSKTVIFKSFEDNLKDFLEVVEKQRSYILKEGAYEEENN